jgi:hypothetical protein
LRLTWSKLEQTKTLIFTYLGVYSAVGEVSFLEAGLSSIQLTKKKEAVAI